MYKAERSRSYMSVVRIFHRIWLSEKLRMKRWNHFHTLELASELRATIISLSVICFSAPRSLNHQTLYHCSSFPLVIFGKWSFHFLLRWKPLIRWALLCTVCNRSLCNKHTVEHLKEKKIYILLYILCWFFFLNLSLIYLTLIISWAEEKDILRCCGFTLMGS